MTKKEQLKSLIKKSVLNVINTTPRPFGIFLSGGVDSGLLAAMTRPDVAFTCKFPYGGKFDEFPSAEKTAKYLKIRQVVVEPTKEDFFQYLPEALRAFQKTSHFSFVPLYMLFKKAKEEGITTILSGEGPDEYLGGYTAYSIIMAEQKLYEQKELWNYSPMLDRYLGTLRARYARLLGKTEEEIAPHWDKYENIVSKMGYTDSRVKGIEDMELALAKHFGINLIYPYMTPEIERFCFEEVPDRDKIRRFTTKYIFKQIAERYIPKDIVWRSNKMGGPVAPVSHWLDHAERPFDKEPYLKLQDEILSKQS